MKRHHVSNLDTAKDTLNYLNHFHDGSIRNASFTKARSLDLETGALCYEVDYADMDVCDVTLEMLLNSFEGAKRDQVVRIHFQRVREFSFSQAESADYSEVIDSEVRAGRNQSLQFIFYATEKKLPILTLSCESVEIVEV